jgi:flagellin
VPITLGSNIASLKAQRRLAEGTTQLSKTYERLSSGQRINRASDDAAGLAISESLKSDKRVFNQGIRNFNDGVSLLNIADGAIENLTNITVRLKELAEQSANGTYGVQQRKALDAEAQALSKEYLRIAQSTKFNGRDLFGGSFGTLRLQGGFGVDGGIQSGLGGAIGTGTFQSATTFTMTGTYSYSPIITDVNNDGIQDAVTTSNTASGTAFVRLGVGDGTFATAISYVNGSASLQLGDVNGDGVLDMVFNNTTGISTRLGAGNGTFGNAISSAGGTSTVFALGDLNGDGKVDIVSSGYDSTLYAPVTTIRLGNGNGTFSLGATYLGSGEGNPDIKLGDLNNDGILDIVLLATDSPAVDIRLGTGTGQFGSSSSLSVASDSPTSLVLGDINGDGNLDILVGGHDEYNGSVEVTLGRGNGTFQSTTTTYSYANEYVQALALGDLNGDGILDLTTAGGYNSGAMSVRLGTGTGTFRTATSYATEATVSTGVALGDLNSDGVLDILTTGSGGGAAKSTLRLSNTNNGISPLLSFTLTSRADSLQAFSQFDKALSRLSTQRGIIGAFQSRLNVGTNVLAATSENYAAAESRIRNADVAEESSQLTRLNILQKAGTAVLAQANLQPQLALKLLRN